MKGVLIYNLNNSDDADQFKYAQAGLNALCLLDDLDNELRNKTKYDGGIFADYDGDTIEKVRQYLWELRNERRLPELT